MARNLDVMALCEAREAVESLQAALSVAAAAEEAAKTEVIGMKSQLRDLRTEEESRYHRQLRAQAEQMRLHQRVGELMQAASLREAAAESATIDVVCLQHELARAEAAVEAVQGDLVAERAHAMRQLATLREAHEREAHEHADRLAAFEAALERLRTQMGSEQRVDPRIFLEQIEPAMAMVEAGARHELQVAQAVSATWANLETEAALQRAASAEARLDECERARRAEAERRRTQQAQERTAVQAREHTYTCYELRTACCVA